MNQKKLLILLTALAIIGVALAVGLYFAGKTTNRSVTETNVSASSNISGYTMRFQMTPAFADFFFDRGFWNTNGVRIQKKQPHTVKSVVITLKDKKQYKGAKDPALPVILASNVAFAPDLKSKIYKLDVYIGKEETKRYSEKDLERNIFLAVLSQIYEDTARSVTSYEGRIAKSVQVTKIADLPGANPIDIK